MIVSSPGEKFISPQSELGAFYLCPAVLSGYCFVCESFSNEGPGARSEQLPKCGAQPRLILKKLKDGKSAA